MSATFSEENWYRIPCLLGAESGYEMYICKKLLKSPCVCCGQDHPEARIVRNETTGEEQGEYICEVSRVHGKSFGEAVSEEGVYRHVPCPQRFALRNGYQLSDIALSWDIFMEKGYGHHIPYRRLRMLWEEIMTICEEERRSWEFTRDNRWKPQNGKVEDDDDEGMDDIFNEGEVEGLPDDIPEEGSNKRRKQN
jgi:hypothetical protein